MQEITSRDNPKLKRVRALIRSKKVRQEESCFVMEGVRALSALADGSGLPCYRLREVWVSGKADAASLPRFQTPLFSISHDLMEQLSDCRTSQGLLGVVEVVPEPLDLHPERGGYLLLDRLSDPGNLGTLIRSAVAFGLDGVLLYGDCVEVFNPKTVRATMGALPFCRCRQVDEADLARLAQAGYDLIATVIRGGESLYEIRFGPKNVLIIGSEARGVSAELQQRATRKLSIPMSGNVESLNAAVAGSICMARMGVSSVRPAGG